MIRFEPLQAHHETSTFRSGASFLDYYLQYNALAEQIENNARTFVAIDSDGSPERILGYFTLKLSPQYLPLRSGEWIAVAELAYLARDASWRGLGLGSALLIESLRYLEEASRRVGFPGVFLYATEEGMPLYEAYRFQRLSPDRKAYFLSLDSLQQMLQETGQTTGA